MPKKTELAVIVPTKGRPDNIRKVISAWDFTNAWDVADLVLAIDSDDPEREGYLAVYEDFLEGCPHGTPSPLQVYEVPVWRPMAAKLNEAAVALAHSGHYFALGFAGDDHLPQTMGWAERYLTVLHEMGTGMVYGDDGYQGRKLSTEWAVTADAVRALGRMVPAPVEHMYSDNSMMDLFNAAGAIRHLPEVRVEHFNPYAGGKAPMDEQYKRVNGRDQYRRDRLDYERWKRSGLAEDAATVRALRPGAPEFRLEPVRPIVRPVVRTTRDPRLRSGPTRERINMNRFPFTREFKEVRGATPDEIGMVLADFAAGVPADQEIVELGVFQGRTALIMAWGARQGNGAHVTAVDPWNLEGNVYDPPFTDADSKAWAEYRIRELGYAERIELVQAFSHEIAGDWSGKPVGLLFVDGDHTKEGARLDIEAWAPHLAPGATIAVDDYHHPDWPGVAEAVDELVEEGVLAPVTIYHERLAVTKLTERQEWATTGHAAEPIGEPMTHSQRGIANDLPVRAITSEGVATADDAAPEPDTEVSTDLAEEWRRVDPEGVAALEKSAGELEAREVVAEGEVGGVAAGTPITDLNTGQLRTLAKARGIRLGVRKDKREAMLQALRDGE
jgi:predicted O-methyltransferase YrrM